MLVIKAYVNDHPIGTIHIQRVSGQIGEPCEYKIRYPKGFSSKTIQHHYDDGWMPLVSKAIARIIGRKKE